MAANVNWFKGTPRIAHLPGCCRRCKRPSSSAVITVLGPRPLNAFFSGRSQIFSVKLIPYKQNIKKGVAKWHFWRQNCKIGKEYCDREFNTHRKQLFFGLQSKSVDLIDSSYVLIMLILLYTCWLIHINPCSGMYIIIWMSACIYTCYHWITIIWLKHALWWFSGGGPYMQIYTPRCKHRKMIWWHIYIYIFYIMSVYIYICHDRCPSLYNGFVMVYPPVSQHSNGK